MIRPEGVADDECPSCGWLGSAHGHPAARAATTIRRDGATAQFLDDGVVAVDRSTETAHEVVYMVDGSHVHGPCLVPVPA